MSDFTPNTKIYLGNVPFDPSYKHVRLFTGDTVEKAKENQRSAIAGRCPSALRREDYTYQRLNNTLKVPYNAEQLYKYNYCMFQNTNYGDKWFYAFITNVEYVSESTSRLWLQTDEFQTWFLDSTMQTCYVEREHVIDDSIGAHIKDEGLTTGEPICRYTMTSYENALYIVAASAAEPFKDGTYMNVAGDTYFHVPSGCSISVFANQEDFKAWMNALADNGQQDAVSAVYLVPATIISGNWLKRKVDEHGNINGWGYWLESEQDVNKVTKTFAFLMDSLDGYVPQNNKMFCYPFQYCEVTNFMGDSQQFRFEFMNPVGTLKLKATGGADVNAHMSYVPENYNNIDDFWEGAINLGQFPTCQWVYQTYTNWQGQGKVTLGIDGIGGIETNARTQLPYWQNFGKAMTNNIGVVEGVLQALVEVGATRGKSVAAELTRGDIMKSAGVSATGGLLQNNMNMLGDHIQTMADLQQQQRQPNTSKSATNTSVNQVSVRNYGIAVRKYTCRYEFAKMCDDYLSAYGYNVSEFKVPNLTHREHWNYVKTIGLQLQGEIPASAMQTIQSIFDNGVTLWHDWDIGNYGQRNKIV